MNKTSFSPFMFVCIIHVGYICVIPNVYVYIYVCVCVCVCVLVCACVCARAIGNFEDREVSRRV